MSGILKVHSRNLQVLWLVTLISSLAANLTAPVWSIYIRSLRASMTELGYILSLSNAMTAILQIPSGWFSDRYGRKRIHIAGTLIGVFPPLAYTFARNWTDLIPWVVISGVSTGLYSTVRWSIVADDSTVKTRAMAYSWMNISWLIGNVAGPILGGLLADSFGIKTPFLACFMLSFMYLPFVFMIEETKWKSPPQKSGFDEGGCAKMFLSAATVFFLVNMLQGMGYGAFFTVTPIFMLKRFSAEFFHIGLVNAVGYGLASMVVQIPGGLGASRCDKKRLLIVTTLISSPFYALLPSSRSVADYLLYIFISNAVLAFSWPAFQDWMMSSVPSSKWGFMNGLAATSFWAGLMAGSAISGLIWDLFGMFVPYYFVSMMIFLSVIPVLFIERA
ncbi:MAG: MFS transporter [Candidatus Bathyarchaeia archaeon]